MVDTRGVHPMAILGRALGEARAVARGDTATHRHLRSRVTAVLLISIVVDLVCAVLALALERHAPRTDVHSFGTALFWTTTQLTTVSSQMTNPQSTGGRILDVLMEIYAITVVATLAGSFGAFFHRRGHERDAEVKRVAH